ncbi:MAG: N-6 DNA methylase [Nanoarchaeota archaeon]|nr:N-6 DNA methylase [Nanoarchaeota archaeon]
MPDKETAKEEIRKLIEKYNRLVESGKLKSYNEEMTKKDFILPLFRILGWNVEDGDEVTAEERISGGRVDYAFRIDGIPKLFIEAKALKVDLDKIEFAEQAINYAWHKGATWAVLTDFEGVKVFNAEWKSQNPLQNMFFAINCSQFLDRFEQLWLLSRESLENGIIDNEAEKWGKKAKKIPVDKQLLSDLTRFRDLLNKNILKNNASKNISGDELDETVQRILDRLLFIRTLEDKHLEAPVLQALIREDKHKKVFKKLNILFREIDDVYNSKLFRPHLCEELILDDDLLEKIISGLFKTSDNTVHYDFGAIDADVLGNMYEQYLGHIMKKTAKRAKLTSGKAHRKQQGIYYTPTYVVDYIVKNTIGELAKNKKFDLKNIKILDPACGSGSFLMKAFDYLVTFDKKKNGDIDQTKLDLTGASAVYGRKVEILKENIFGIDLDPKAVEIAQLNLLLKAAEKKHRLPTLQENIKVGNSLIDDSTVAGKRAFKWEEEFKQIMDKGGFDVVIGNPPYGATFNDSELEYLKRFKTSKIRNYDSYIFFIEKVLLLLKMGGIFSFIVPDTFLRKSDLIVLRELILSKFNVKKIVEIGAVFEDAKVTENVIFVLEKCNNSKMISKNKFTHCSMNKDRRKEERLILLSKQKWDSSGEVKQTSWKESPEMRLGKYNSHKLINIIEKIENSQLIKDIDDILISRGSEGGKNLIKKSKINEGYKLIVIPDDISKYSVAFNDRYFPIRDTNLDKYHKEKLLIIRIRNTRLKDRIIASYDNSGVCTLKTLQILNLREDSNLNLKFILGVLNSKVINFYCHHYLSDDINKKYIMSLRLLVPDLNRQAKIIELVEKINLKSNELLELKHKQTDEKFQIEKEIHKLDSEIDQKVYKLYGLTKEEIKIVEDSLNN